MSEADRHKERADALSEALLQESEAREFAQEQAAALGQRVKELSAALEQAEAKAWDALARYKFWMFGYHAAQWVLLNQLLEARKPNPWSGLVKLARLRQLTDPRPDGVPEAVR